MPQVYMFEKRAISSSVGSIQFRESAALETRVVESPRFIRESNFLRNMSRETDLERISEHPDTGPN